MLTLLNVKKSYDRREVLLIPYLHLDKGVYVVKGRNGSGKTTLLKIIAGIIPFEGDVLHQSISIRKSPTDYRRMIGWTVAQPLFPSFVSGEQMIHFYCSVKGVEKKHAAALAEVFGLDSFLKQRVEGYSSGMTKKLALVLALIGKSPLIILDEPFITLDSQAVQVLRSLIQQWHRQDSISFIISSHIEEENEFTGNCQQLLLADGRLKFHA